MAPTGQVLSLGRCVAESFENEEEAGKPAGTSMWSIQGVIPFSLRLSVSAFLDQLHSFQLLYSIPWN